ncbi:hypothetical protein SAY86_008410 [Trapa natans]|uniref:BHLH domain-containing protein n=1 Tax=Trapa natans TaxID=22666 RepID=A0AAN7KA43_TRANT|nr:hypothetical protein SAY86_008410 [Trapa natans]
MDPPALPLVNGGAFPGVGGAAPYNLAEIWPFQLNGGQPVGRLLGLLSGPGNGISHFSKGSGANHEAGGDGSAGLEQRMNLGRGGRKRLDSEDEMAKADASTSNGEGLNSCDAKRLKTSRDENGGDCSKAAESEPSSAKDPPKPQPQEPSKQDYIHVRARRGQATDSHSLAERARREKISERMKILQDLVPGCNKVIGKALVLDEIINYIQSLQRQVEFLSMKLEAVNSRLTPGNEIFPSKDFDAGGIPFASQAPREYPRGSLPEWLHMQVGGSFDRRT